MRTPHMFDSLTLSSLEKVMPNAVRPGRRLWHATMLKNERFHYQAAVKTIVDDKAMVTVRVTSALADAIRLYEVGQMPCELTRLPANDPRDTNFITTEPGLFPDILEDIPAAGLSLTPKIWKSVWVSVYAGDGRALTPGTYPIEIGFYHNDKQVAASHLVLEVLDAALPAQELIYTAWFHPDALMTYYGVEAFSEAHWRLMESFIRMAVSRGQNMILTPCLTPPLDTAVGGERPTVQLVGVRLDKGVYSFDFTLLDRYIKMCSDCGIRYFEINHLFTQWGAYYAPKVMATVDGVYKRIAGWDTPACGEVYAGFLRAYLPALTARLRALGIAERCYFHISDEPSVKHLDSYKAASELAAPYLEDFTVIDALSDYDFFARGLVKTPIPSTHSADEFKEHNVSPLWCYYCAFGSDFLTMRYFSTPSARNRIFGYQLYKYDIAGFLHWGYNFYAAQFSLYPEDPLRHTDSGGWCPSGDNYLVYPGKDGPISSIRNEVFADALQDLRALRALEAKLGREKVIALIDSELFVPLSMYDYPTDDEWLLSTRDKINRLLAAE